MSGYTNNFKHLTRHVLRENVFCSRRVQKLIANESRSLDEMLSYQTAMLRRTLESAKRQLPAFRHLTIPSRDDALTDHLNEIVPMTTKAQLLDGRNGFYPNAGHKRPWTISGKTSGTTGTPLEIFRSFDSVVWENAFIHRHWHWSGFRKGMRRAMLRGDQVTSLDQTEPPFWYVNKFDNQLLLSTRHLSLKTGPQFAHRLRSYAPHLLQAYPSAAFLLAQSLEAVGESLNIPFVYTGSEMLYPHQRELIEARLGHVVDFYGMAERVAFASECEHGNMHVNSDYSFVEIVDDDGMPTNGEGHVVGTTYHNHLMPLVRYRLSDRTRWKSGICPCGRNFPMIEQIQGKFEDMLYGSHQNPISPSIVTFAFKGVENIVLSQVAQVAAGEWEIRIVPGVHYCKHDGERIIANVLSMVDRNLKVRIALVAEIPRTDAGKYRWIVNEMDKKKATCAELRPKMDALGQGGVMVDGSAA